MLPSNKRRIYSQLTNSNQQILLKLVNAHLPMLRRHTRQFSCWTWTTKGTLTLKLNKKSDSSALVTRNLVTK